MNKFTLTNAKFYGEEPINITVENGVVTAIGNQIDGEVVAADGLVLLPGFVG